MSCYSVPMKLISGISFISTFNHLADTFIQSDQYMRQTMEDKTVHLFL